MDDGAFLELTDFQYVKNFPAMLTIIFTSIFLYVNLAFLQRYMDNP